MEILINWDTNWLLFFNGLHTPFLDSIMWFFSQSKVWIPLYLAIFAFIFRKLNLREASFALLRLLLVVGLADLISVKLFKEVFQRLRPSHNPEISGLLHLHKYNDGQFYTGGLYGFVSSHAANTFALASFTSLIFRIKPYSILIITWAVIVSYSRIYLGVHYPFDILGGAILGTIIALLFYYLFNFVLKKWPDLKLTPP